MTSNNYKIVLLGESTVGKTSFTERVKHNTFKKNTYPTIGCEFTGVIRCSEKYSIKLLIWDTSGKNVFKVFNPQFCRNASLALVFYDLTKPIDTLGIESCFDSIPDSCDVLIVPTKYDLYKNYNIQHFDVKSHNHKIYFSDPISSKENTGIDILLDKICDILVEKPKTPYKKKSPSKVGRKEQNKYFCC
jgi:Ras-related protein Rab-1A